MAQKTSELPLYSLSKLGLSLATREMNILSKRQGNGWKDCCQVLLKYLQTHDLSNMPEALHQRLYMVLTEIAKALGDNIPCELPVHQQRFFNISGPLQEAARSISPISTIQHPQLTRFQCSPLTSSLLCNRSWSDLESTPQQLLAPGDINFEKVELAMLKAQLQSQNQVLRQKQKDLKEIKQLYKDTVLESENYLLEEFTVKEELNKKLNSLEADISQKDQILIQNEDQIKRLKAIPQKRQTIHRINSDLISPLDHQVNINRLPSQLADEDILTMHSLSRPHRKHGLERLKPARKPSTSAESGDQADMMAFQTQEGSQFSFRNNDRLLLLQRRIEDLQNDLKMKDEVLSAINTFINNQGESILGEKSNLDDLLKRCELKQKYLSYCSLAEENAYLKKCMDKLTKSEEFWSNLHEGKKQEEKEDKKKCLIF